MENSKMEACHYNSVSQTLMCTRKVLPHSGNSEVSSKCLVALEQVTALTFKIPLLKKSLGDFVREKKAELNE